MQIKFKYYSIIIIIVIIVIVITKVKLQAELKPLEITLIQIIPLSPTNSIIFMVMEGLS